MERILALGLQNLVDLLENLAITQAIIHHLGDLGLQGGRNGHCKEWRKDTERIQKGYRKDRTEIYRNTMTVF